MSGSGSGAMRRVVRRTVGAHTATERLECGHDNVLYREVRGGKVTWVSRRGHRTALTNRSRECAACLTGEGEPR